jgi:hypothetical protein
LFCRTEDHPDQPSDLGTTIGHCHRQERMTEPTEITITIDAKTKALRSGNRWAVMRRQPDGSWDCARTWSGGRRSLLQYLNEQDIHPTRDAEVALGQIAEQQGFKER